MIPIGVQQVEDVEIPHLIFGDGAFPLRTFLMKPHGGAILADGKSHFNDKHSRAKLVTERAFGKLKDRLRALFVNVKVIGKLSNYGLAALCFILCNERGDLVPRKFDLMRQLNVSVQRKLGIL